MDFSTWRSQFWLIYSPMFITIMLMASPPLLVSAECLEGWIPIFLFSYSSWPNHASGFRFKKSQKSPPKIDHYPYDKETRFYFAGNLSTLKTNLSWTLALAISVPYEPVDFPFPGQRVRAFHYKLLLIENDWNGFRLLLANLSMFLGILKVSHDCRCHFPFLLFVWICIYIYTHRNALLFLCCWTPHFRGIPSNHLPHFNTPWRVYMDIYI